MNSNLPMPNNGSWPLVPPGQMPATMAPGQRNYISSNVLDFPTLLRILQQWRWLILGAVAAGLALGILATLLTTPLYRAKVVLEANPPSVAVSDEQSKEIQSTVNQYEFIATQVGLLSSQAVAERAAEDLNLANNPEVVDQEADSRTKLKAAAGVVSGGLNVSRPVDSNLIEFTYDSPSPQLAAIIANGVAESFINTTLQRRYEASAYARNFLERQIAKTRSDLEKSERSMVAYAQKQGIISTSSADSKTAGSDANSLQGDSLIALNQALAQATARRVAAEGAYRQSQSVGQTADVTQSTSALRSQRATLEAEYQQKRTFQKPDHPEMLSLRSQIEELTRQINREAGQVASGRSNTLLADYRAALSAESALQARVAGLKGQVLDLRGRSIQYNILQREVDTNRSLYDALLQRYKEIGVAGGIGLAPVSIVDRASTPSAPYKPNMLMNLLLGLLFGTLAGVAAAVSLEFLSDTIKSREDVRKKLGLACLGVIPKAADKGEIIEELKNQKSLIAEAYSAVVAALRFSSEKGTPKVILLTSTRPSEGKSSSALALAQNFARRGKNVLLIDSDLRKPAFKGGNEHLGLSKLLTTDDPAANHIVQTQYDNLSLLASGPVPPNPADLLSTPRLSAILSEVSKVYDMVIVDGPPTLGLADPPLLAATVGSVVFIIEAGRTRTRSAIEALNRLETTSAHILGVILTKSSDRQGGYGYGYGSYGYGYGYGSDVEDKRAEILMIPHDSDDEKA